jgi:hypothetical protein
MQELSDRLHSVGDRKGTEAKAPNHFVVFLSESVSPSASNRTISLESARRSPVGTADGLSTGGIIDNQVDTSPYRSDCADHFRTAQDRMIDFSDTAR